MSPPNKKIAQPMLFDDEPTQHPAAAIHSNNHDWVFNIQDALFSPKLTFSMNWADSIPQRIIDIIPLARMFALRKNETLAPYEECLVYIYTRTLEAPMNSDWTDIYGFVCCYTMKKWFGEDHWEDTKSSRQLSQWNQSKLDDLRRHLYKKRREILKKQLHVENKQAAQERASKPPTAPASIQQSLFDF